MSTQVTEESTSRTVQTKVGALHFNDTGEGRALILLHGAGPGATGWSNFSSNIPVLGERFRVLAVDMPGWGRSEPVDAAEQDHVEAVRLLMDELGIDRATVVGNSMGGSTALRLAVRHPERVSHVVTMGASAGGTRIFSPGGRPSEGLGLLFETYRDPSPAGMKRLISMMTYDQRFATDELAAQRSEAALAQPEHIANFLEGLKSPPRGLSVAEEDLKRIEVPVLVLHGRDDRVLSFEASLQLVSTIPNSRMVLFNRCGHWVQLEHAAEFNRLVEQFVLCS